MLFKLMLRISITFVIAGVDIHQTQKARKCILDLLQDFNLIYPSLLVQDTEITSGMQLMMHSILELKRNFNFIFRDS